MSEGAEGAREDPAVDALVRYRLAEGRLWATGNHTISDPERIAAASEVRRSVFDILAFLNQEGSLSEAYKVLSCPGGKRADAVAMELGADVLKEFARVFSARRDATSEGLYNAMMTLALNLAEVAAGQTPSSSMIASHGAAPGRPQRSLRTLQSQKTLVLAVHFVSGRDGVTLDRAFKTVSAAVTFETFKEWQKEHVPSDERRLAKSAGRKIRQQASLNTSEAQIAETLGEWVVDGDAMRILSNLASGTAPPVPTWERRNNPRV